MFEKLQKAYFTKNLDIPCHFLLRFGAIVNEVIKPKKVNEWNLNKEDGSTSSNHQEVADIFNSFFIKKVEDLKSSIDKDYTMDPLDKLSAQKKIEKTFRIKPVTQQQLIKHMSKMKKKQSAGIDGLSQDKLVLGSKSLIYPLLQIINQSVREGAFPSIEGSIF